MSPAPPAGRRRTPEAIIHSRAPLRVNDIGGWTDTWFAGRGSVLNMAVGPPVQVQAAVFSNPGRAAKRVFVRADDYGSSFWMTPERPSRRIHPLLQFCVAALPPPRDVRLEVRIHSPVPGGVSMGTSASVCVALLGALARASGRRLPGRSVARLAHRVETEMLGLQSGVQDQLCAAVGGICHIRLVRYPAAAVDKLRLDPAVIESLSRRLMVVDLGKPHCSSDLHEQVISLMKEENPRFETLRRMARLAGLARLGLERGDLQAFGRIMSENNERQRELCRELVSAEADEVIRLARKRRSAGWKVNGAGGRGGSLTVLASADDGERRALVRDIEALGRGIRTLPVSLSPSGLAVWRAL